jgi:hypothetical protein
MTRIKLPTGETVLVTGSPEDAARAQSLVDARHAFVVEYCRSKGWPEEAARLSIDQILEIRSQPGWQKPSGHK